MNAMTPPPPTPTPATVGAFVPHPFAPPTDICLLPEGVTVAELITWAVVEGKLTHEVAKSEFLTVQINGQDLPRMLWPFTRHKPGTHILVGIRPGKSKGGGGKNPLRTILTLLVVVAVAAISGGALATPLLGGLFGVGSTSALILASVASIALNALVNAIAPLPQGHLAERKKSEQGYSISGARNVVDPYGPCILVLGQHRVTPRLAMRYFTDVVGDVTSLFILLQWHAGKCSLVSLKIGDTDIGGYTGVTQQHRLLGQPYSSAITLIDHVVVEADVSIELKSVTGFITRTSIRNATKLAFDLSCPAGMFIMNNGTPATKTVDYVAEYSPAGAGTWTGIPTSASGDGHVISTGNIRFALAQDKLVRRKFEWTVTAGQYDVRVRRSTGDSTDPNHIDQTYWVCLRSHQASAPVLNDDICVSAIKIQASDQLSGVVDDLNGIVTSIVPVKGTGDWSTEAATSNCGALWRWLLTGPAISPVRRLTASGLNVAEVDAFYDYSAANSLECNAVIDYTASIEELLQLTASCGYASSCATLGKRTVVIDDEKLPTQLFTAETVRNFRGKIAYLEDVHALRCNFGNKASGYETDQVIVYADGKDVSTATKFQTAEIPGKVTYQEAWWAGRRLLKRAQYRRIGYEFEIDAECLVSRYGQRALVEHFALRSQSASARVKSVVGASGSVTGVVLDKPITFGTGAHGLQVRRGADGELPVFALTNPGAGTATDTLAFTATALLAVEPAAGDLVVIGPAAKICEDVSIINLKPASDDFSATVSCVPYTADLFSDDGASVPAFLSNVVSRKPDPVLTPEASSVLDQKMIVAALANATAALTDGVLSPSEKVSLVPQLKQLLNSQSGLDTRANSVGVTTEKTAYDTAISTLATYLATLTTPVAWDDQSGNSNVAAPATFISNMRAAMEAEVALQNAIDAKNANTQAAFSAVWGRQFDAGLDGFLAINATIGAANGILTVTPTTSDPSIYFDQGVTGHPAVAGASNKFVRVRARPLGATPSWDGTVLYQTSGHGFSLGGYFKNIANPGVKQNEWQVFEWDMSSLADWNGNTITGIRVDLGSGTDVWEVDWVAIGNTNIDPSMTRGIKDNADQTSANIAGGFTGSAALAYLNTVNLASTAPGGVSGLLPASNAAGGLINNNITIDASGYLQGAGTSRAIDNKLISQGDANRWSHGDVDMGTYGWTFVTTGPGVTLSTAVVGSINCVTALATFTGAGQNIGLVNDPASNQIVVELSAYACLQWLVVAAGPAVMSYPINFFSDVACTAFLGQGFAVATGKTFAGGALAQVAWIGQVPSTAIRALAYCYPTSTGAGAISIYMGRGMCSMASATQTFVPDWAPPGDTTLGNMPINSFGGVAQSRTPANVFTSTDATVSIAAHTITYPLGSVSMPPGSVTGLTAATLYGFHYDGTSTAYVPALANSATDRARNADQKRYRRIGSFYTQNTGSTGYPTAPSPPAGSGGGGGGYTYEF